MTRGRSAHRRRRWQPRSAGPQGLLRCGSAGVLVGACLGLAYGLLLLPHPLSYAAETAWVGVIVGAAVGTFTGWLGLRRRTRGGDHPDDPAPPGTTPGGASRPVPGSRHNP